MSKDQRFYKSQLLFIIRNMKLSYVMKLLGLGCSL